MKESFKLRHLILFYITDLYGGTLVVCTNTLIGTWKSEAEKCVKRDSMSVCLFYGEKRKRDARELSTTDLVITTHLLILNEVETLGRIKWKRIVWDEAHTKIIRNHKNHTTAAFCRLNGANRWLLATDKSVQNDEVYSLLIFFECSPFSNLQNFKNWIKLQRGGDHLAKLLEPMLLQDKCELNAVKLNGFPNNKVDYFTVLFTTKESSTVRFCYT